MARPLIIIWFSKNLIFKIKLQVLVFFSWFTTHWLIKIAKSHWTIQRKKAKFMEITGTALWQRSFSSFNSAHKYEKRKWVFATNSDFLIAISLQPNFVNLRYFKLWIMLDQIGLKYHRFTSSGCKDIGIRKFEFVAKT